jgi:N-acetylglucosaminyldiphosphoundecaprenol N-acetyl-beta-D-mannosaminyltransferase
MMRAARANIAGVPVDNLTEDETVEAIDRLLAAAGSHYMAVVNASKITVACRNPELLRILKAADLVTADGMSVVWASRLLGRPLKARVTGIDLLQRLVRHAAARGLSVYFLGASEASVSGAVTQFVSLRPALRVAGYRNGYFASSEAGAIAEAIKRTGANFLFVAMGSPAQELWIYSNLDATGAQFALGVGGSFDHISGLSRRAPRWMQQAGLEWLYRLAREPGRLWRRYLIGNTKFAWLVIRQFLSQTLGRHE